MNWVRCVVILLASASLTSCAPSEPRQLRKVFTDPYPSGAIRPMWLAPDNCRKAEPKDVRIQDAAIRTAESFPDAPRHIIASTALGVLSEPWGPVNVVVDDLGILCPPARLAERLARAAHNTQVFSEHGKLDQHGLQLARAVGPRSPLIVRAVANTAFSEHVVPDNGDLSDLRPFARLILAEFGSAAAPWEKQAERETSLDSELGVGAAQIVGATGNPAGLARIEQLMMKRLDRHSKGEVVGVMERDRLYGLAYALGMAGQKAAPYTSALIDLMNRKVSKGGVAPARILVHPRRMCWVADRIGGRAAEVANTKSYCGNRFTLSEY